MVIAKESICSSNEGIVVHEISSEDRNKSCPSMCNSPSNAFNSIFLKKKYYAVTVNQFVM